MNMAGKLSLALLAVTLTASSATFAQAPAADSAPCTPQEQSNQTLGEKLNQTNGVICPPEVDPAMRAPTPKGVDPSVIPPAGTPGGDQNVQPK
ncbi:MAG TPA: hypothetical protein VMR17_01905 [Xanthobacteraceae bacterium]|nr:hypothetical protein [Xanthobacteraceae bacterium]